ncbi:MAG: C39 family peptidase [Bacillota bacterium]|nr:C39 family peptidase [Bacillota bacterium]
MTDNYYNEDIQNCRNFIHVPLCYQETEYTCGVACTQSILARYGIYYRQSALAGILRSQPILGTDYQTILYFMQLLGLKAAMAENMEIDDLKKYISRGITPMLTIQAWPEDEIEYHYDWKDAHYILACGYYDNGIFAMDPYTLGNYTYLSFSELLRRWHAVDKDGVRHIKSGLIIEYENCPIKYNPKAIKHLG